MSIKTIWLCETEQAFWFERTEPHDLSDKVTVTKMVPEVEKQGCDFCNHSLYAGTKCKNCANETQQEPVIDKTAAIRIATSLGWEPKRQSLTDEEIRKAKHHMVDGAYQYSFMQGVRYAEAAHGIKEKNT